MRLGVLDIGSNTGHLLVVDAHDGAAPLPAFSYKEPLRLAEHLDDAGDVTPAGIDALAAFTAQALVVAEEKGCEEMLPFATSAVRDAGNSEAVLQHVAERTGVRIEVLAGADEARLTFLAVRRWFGWSAGRLAVFDIGGGSLEIAAGGDERPDVAWSLPLGAARLAREFAGHLPSGAGPAAALRSAAAVDADAAADAGTPPSSEDGPSVFVDEDKLRAVRRRIRADIARDAGNLLRAGTPHRAAATSKTFRSLARICGAAPSGDGPLVPRNLPLAELRAWIPKLVQMTPEELAALPGVSPSRTHQIVPGALVAEACMDIFDLAALEICPWALREGVILERLDGFRAADES
ncbi:Ppx/GppA family phosphatase [Nocardioides sp.]|uniref:Ppx/GppA phosphatase family protein n=1 Tax=Nocardioides sp. TaxID=35761 RepID=UPI003518613E